MRHWLFGAAVLALLAPGDGLGAALRAARRLRESPERTAVWLSARLPCRWLFGQLSPSHATGLAAPRQGCGPDDRICVRRTAGL